MHSLLRCVYSIYENIYAHVAQLVEAMALEVIQCRFESDRGYQLITVNVA